MYDLKEKGCALTQKKRMPLSGGDNFEALQLQIMDYGHHTSYGIDLLYNICQL
jgi:hypothetical protein